METTESGNDFCSAESSAPVLTKQLSLRPNLFVFGITRLEQEVKDNVQQPGDEEAHDNPGRHEWPEE